MPVETATTTSTMAASEKEDPTTMVNANPLPPPEVSLPHRKENAEGDYPQQQQLLLQQHQIGSILTKAVLTGRGCQNHSSRGDILDPMSTESSSSRRTGQPCQNCNECSFDSSDNTNTTTTNRRQKKRKRSHCSFPEKLHNMLSTIESEGSSDIISWQPHGRSFRIHDKERFAEAIMTRFFQQSKFTSFQRQLNLYGFARFTTGTDRGSYYHELFVAGRPDLCRQMSRTRIKTGGKRLSSCSHSSEDRNTEPNFYSDDGLERNQQQARCVSAASTSTTSSTTKTVTENDYVPTLLADIAESMRTDQLMPSQYFNSSSNPAPCLPLACLSSETTSPNKQRLQLLMNPSVQQTNTTANPASSQLLLSAAPFVLPPPLEAAPTGANSTMNLGKRVTALPSSTCGNDATLISRSSSISKLHSGELAFFEGKSFRYMDHITNPKDLDTNTPAPSVSPPQSPSLQPSSSVAPQRHSYI